MFLLLMKSVIQYTFLLIFSSFSISIMGTVQNSDIYKKNVSWNLLPLSLPLILSQAQCPKISKLCYFGKSMLDWLCTLFNDILVYLLNCHTTLLHLKLFCNGWYPDTRVLFVSDGITATYIWAKRVDFLASCRTRCSIC